MKTSIKLFIGAVALMGGSLFLYDWKLADEYRKGDYTDPYYTYKKLSYRDFDEIELRSGTSVNMVVQQGEFKVLEHPQASEFVVMRQEGRRLIIEAKFEDSYRFINAPRTLFISCPMLSLFRSDTKYIMAGLPVTDFANWNEWWLPTVIRGFGEDSMTILEDHGSKVEMEGNTIRRLEAVVGGDGGTRETGVSESLLIIGQGNQFDSSDLKILSKSRLWIRGTDMRRVTYHLPDRA